MMVPLRTFALFGVALAMLAAGYLFAPAPAATRVPTPLPTRSVAEAPPAPRNSAPAVVAARPPVPIPRTTHAATVERPSGAPASGKPTVDMGVFDINPPDPNEPTQVQALQTAGDAGQAKQAIEFDGYKGVRNLAKGADGLWHGRALRGRTEVGVRVDAGGNVSAE
jgi:hypothetical protein